MTPKEEYEWYKSKGICVKCHQRDAEPHRVSCFECMEKQRNADSTRVRDKAKRAKEQRELRQKKKEQGICYRCSKKATHGVHCHEHFLYARRKARERRAKKKKGFSEIGLCRICGEAPVPGKKLCPTHYKEYSDRMIKMNKERGCQNDK